MSSHPSSAHPFDPESDALPDGLPLPPEDGGEVILLLADPATRESGWGPRAAVALARGWASRGRRIFLMDGDPVEPALHAILGEENREGVTDAVRYGVSPSRMAVPKGDNLLFAPAGTVVSDAGSLLRHPRWSSVLGACREAGSVVLLYLPEGRPGVEHLAGEGDRVVRLRDAPLPGGASEPGTVTLHPAAEPEPGSTPAGRPTQGEAAAAVRATGEREVAAPSAAKAGWSGGTSPKGTRGKGKRKKDDFGPRAVGRRTSAWVILIVLLLVGGVVAAAWLGYLDVPGITQPPAAAGPEGPVGIGSDLPTPSP